MKKITLIKMEMKSFKNFTDFTFEPNGENVVAAGMNATGKTSLKDAMLWLFFGKSSDGTNLSPKPVDRQNKELLGLEPTVEATFLVDGEELVLRKELREKWIKPTGKTEKVYEGNKTSCFIDGVPKPIGQYKTFVNDLIDEDTFKVLANTGFFMSDLFKWTKRRELLVEMAGLDDEAIIESTEELKELSDILEKHTLEDAFIMFKSMKKKNTEEIDRIPIAIQENQSMIDELIEKSDESREKIESKISKKSSEIEKQESLINQKKQVGNELEFKQRIMDLRTKEIDERNKYSQTLLLQTGTLNESYRDMQDAVNKLESDYRKMTNDVSHLKSEIESKLKSKQSLREEWINVNKRSFSKDKAICTHCGQNLPAEDVEEMEKQFNEHKIAELREIEEKASKNNFDDNSIESIKDESEALEIEISVVSDDLKAKNERKSEIKEEIDRIVSSQGTFEESNTFKEIAKQIEEIQAEEESERGSINEIIQKENDKLLTLKKESNELQTKLASFTQIEFLEKKIEKYRKDDEELKNQAMDISRKLNLMDEFTRVKSTMVEESVNQKFKHVEFKLFEILNNGGLKETCEAMIDNGTALVGYSQGLNNGGRMLADIDIVNTLSKELGYSIPMFIDNAEGLTSPIETDSQAIRLHVTMDDKLKIMSEDDFFKTNGGVK